MNGYVKIPNSIAHKLHEFTDAEIKALVILQSHAGKGDPYPSHSTIAKRAGWTRRQSEKVVKRLREKGLETYRLDRWGSNRYRLAKFFGEYGKSSAPSEDGTEPEGGTVPNQKGVPPEPEGGTVPNQRADELDEGNKKKELEPGNETSREALDPSSLPDSSPQGTASSPREPDSPLPREAVPSSSPGSSLPEATTSPREPDSFSSREPTQTTPLEGEAAPAADPLVHPEGSATVNGNSPPAANGFDSEAWEAWIRSRVEQTGGHDGILEEMLAQGWIVGPATSLLLAALRRLQGENGNGSL